MTKKSEKQNATDAPLTEENNITPETPIPQETTETPIPQETTETPIPQETTETPMFSTSADQEPFEPIDDYVSSSRSQTQVSSRSRRQKSRSVKTVMVTLLTVCLLAGSLIGYAATYSMFDSKFNDLQNQLSSTQESFNQLGDKINTLQTQIQISQANEQKSVNIETNSNTNTDVVYELAELYQKVKESVVEVKCLVPQYSWFGFQTSYSTQQGSGFVTTSNGQQVIVTNNHVIASGSNITVTFVDGSSYTATVLGADVYADLAILKVDNMPSGVPSLIMVGSSTLKVGDDVVAVGSPYGLSGTLTTGIISALGRTITETVNNRDIVIPDIIQATAEINPGNSGGPLVNYKGQVVGMTTATVSNSQGLGFSIPSDTIMREIDSLITTGKYTQHPAIGVSGRDMTLQLAQSMGINTTSGWLVETATESSGFKSGDVIIKAGSTTIANLDDLLTYLERNTLPGQNAQFTVIRNGQQQTITAQIIARST